MPIVDRLKVFPNRRETPEKRMYGISLSNPVSQRSAPREGAQKNLIDLFIILRYSRAVSRGRDAHKEQPEMAPLN